MLEPKLPFLQETEYSYVEAILLWIDGSLHAGGAFLMMPQYRMSLIWEGCKGWVPMELKLGPKDLFCAILCRTLDRVANQPEETLKLSRTACVCQTWGKVGSHDHGS